MNLKSRHNKSFGKTILFTILGWFVMFRPVDASQTFFPFIADDWIFFEIQTPLASSSAWNGIEVKDGEDGKTTAQKTKDKKTEKAKKKKAQKEKDFSTLSEEEKDVLYKVVSMECDTGYEGSLAVISCMLNRRESERYPDDLMEVVREDSQFTAYYDKKSGTYPYKDREPSKECIAAVDDALNKGKRNIPSYILYFRSSDYDYLKGYITYGQIGDNTYFYLEKDK